MSDEKNRIANRTFGELISDGFRLFAENYTKLILIFAFFYIISIIIGVFILTDLRWYSDILTAKANIAANKYYNNPNSITQEDYNIIIQSFFMNLLIILLEWIIGAIFTVISMCSVSTFVYKKYFKEDADLFDEFKKAFNFNLLKVILLLGLGIPLGFILLVFPGIILFLYFIFLIFTYNSENRDNPISEARTISKGSYLRIIGVFFIALILTGACNMIYLIIISYVWPVNSSDINSWYNPATRNFGFIILYELVNSVILIVFAPLFICLLTPVFASSKARKDLGIITTEKRINIPMQAYYPPASQYGVPLNNGMFCPFCGVKIISPKKFCPRCGKSIIFE
ncbi:MAG: zinc ribbon domain-containing protein [Promethearchaeota archaeon]|nr:MAG: zinc ribbon domain-containing protein [Candidatus Lokiarchaeota archaeon]